MEIGFRWYGKEDTIPLQYIRQIPSVTGIVSAIYDIPAGDIWPAEKIRELRDSIERENLRLSVIESIPVHEDIKMGKPTRDRYIDNYRESIRNMGKAGIPYLCYNFMPVFDWTRSNLSMSLPDGSTTLSYDFGEVEKINLREQALDLPGWGTKYTKEEINRLLDTYAEIGEVQLWKNLEYFLKAVVPVAEESGVKMAIHPDDPPWSIFGLPRIITGAESLEKLVSIVDSPSNGVTFCTGSLGPNATMDLTASLESLLERKRVHFVHMRNIKRLDNGSFYETGHLSHTGDVDMYRIMKLLVDHHFEGVIRPDHGRNIWGETGKPGYGLYDRALGAMYLAGLKEAIEKGK